MNIGPTQSFPAVAEKGSSARKAAPGTSSLGDRPTAGPNEAANRESLPSESLEVVKVHSDTSSGSPILVYDFVDSRTGSLVFQIPSDQMLNLVQDIRQRLQRMTAKSSPAGEK
jgi:hypothetical protein